MYQGPEPLVGWVLGTRPRMTVKENEAQEDRFFGGCALKRTERENQFSALAE